MRSRWAPKDNDDNDRSCNDGSTGNDKDVVNEEVLTRDTCLVDNRTMDDDRNMIKMYQRFKSSRRYVEYQIWSMMNDE